MRQDSTPNLISIVSFLVMGFSDSVPSFCFCAAFITCPRRVQEAWCPSEASFRSLLFGLAFYSMSERGNLRKKEMAKGAC